MISFDEGLELTNKTIDEKLTKVAGNLKYITSYLVKSKGKGVRTSLLLCAAMNENSLISERAALAAASVELLHMATLVHDDVIDNAPMRRGIKTVHEEFGTKEAVICGDYLLCLSMNTAFEAFEDDNSRYIDSIKILTKSISKVCVGEYEQHLENKNLDLSIPKYLKIIHGKTAALFFTAARLGAVLSDCDDEDIRQVSMFGRYLGVLFQIADDCKDYEFDEAQAKKPVKSDASAGVITLPLIYAIQAKPEIKALAGEVMLGKTDSLSLVKEVVELGGVSDAKILARRYKKKAETCIAKIKNEGKKISLQKILSRVEIN
jgi:heptaprenyl diphosphate synthase